MLYRKFGKSGREVSNLGFGCMRLPLKSSCLNGADPPPECIDEERSIELIRCAIDQGVNYFDTAYPYHLGNSEPLLGKAVMGQRDRIMLATKLPPWLVQNRDSFDAFLGEQLGKLGVSYLDFYLVHALDRHSWPRMKDLGILDFLERIVVEGRVHYVGFSFHDDLKTFKEIVNSYDWDMCQIQYNYFDRDSQAGKEGLEYAASKDLGIAVMEPLRGGMLTNKIPSEVQAIWDSAPEKKSPAEWALRWLWNHPQVGIVLSGMNSGEQLQENLRIAGDARPNSLSTEELAIIDQVTDAYRQLYKVPCSSCGYCLPCPQGVNIPRNFGLYNDVFLFDSLKISREVYNQYFPEPERASNCIECGECEQLCPQHISIIEKLKNVHKMLGPE